MQKTLDIIRDNNLKALEDELTKLKSYMYIGPTIIEYENHVNSYINSGNSPSVAYKLVLNDITSIMRNSEEKVNEIIQDRINRRVIQSADQARRSAAGNNFQGIIAYSIIMNIINKNIPNLMVVHQPKKGNKHCQIIEESLQVEVLGEVQKPDCDLLIYNPENDKDPIVIISCKTSIRERGGQTYRWKLLYELSNCKCEHINQIIACPINKYNLQNYSQKNIKSGLISADFYDEFSQPQIRGMATFFDFCFISKNIEDSENIKKLSNMVEYINELYSEKQ